jgi:hypothetical protein
MQERLSRKTRWAGVASLFPEMTNDEWTLNIGKFLFAHASLFLEALPIIGSI